MNIDDYKKSVDQIKVDDEMLNRTRRKIKEKNQKKKGGIFMKMNTKVSYAALTICLVFVIGVIFGLSKLSDVNTNTLPNIKEVEELATLPKVENLETLKELLEKSSSSTGMGETNMAVMDSAAESPAKSIDSGNRTQSIQKESSGSSEYSKTNTQVEGVDEADIVKTDGQYIYYVTTSKIVVVDAKDSKNLKIVSEIKYENKDTESFTPQELFIKDNKLVVVGTKYVREENTDTNNGSTRNNQIMPLIYHYGNTYTVAIVYDISNKEDIKHLRNVEIEGYYVSSRMVGDNVYLVSNKALYPYYILNDGVDARPLMKDTVVAEDCIAIDYKDISYIPESEESNYLIIAAFNITNTNKADIQTILGAGNTVYASEDNMYIVRTKYKYSYTDGIMPFLRGGSNYETEITTEIYKFNLQDGKTEYKCNGSVPGSTINQFAMDENGGYFRIATTDNTNWSGDTSTNNLYILDENLNRVGTLEGLAKGERIYSVRFMGSRAYIVTFKQVDPLFVIDVSNPRSPTVLGELKIPGFSEYLHPYSENLIIGFGQDAETFSDYYGERTLTTGMKMALFDVSDANNPKELFSTKIGGRGTYSELLNNHKALLFSKEKDIIAFPITMTEENATNPSAYSKLIFQGAIVYGLDLEKGFIEKGKISHVTAQGNKTFNYDYDKQIERILYIGDTLFTVSKGLIKSVDMKDMKELNSLEIKVEEQRYMGY